MRTKAPNAKCDPASNQVKDRVARSYSVSE